MMSTYSQSAPPELASLAIDEHSRGPGKLAKRLRFSVLWLASLTFLCLALFVVSDVYHRSKTYRAIVEAAPVQPQPEINKSQVEVLHATGYVTARTRATLSAKITGRLTGLYVDEGMHVEPNQLVAKLDDADARMRLNSAEADCKSSIAAVPDLKIRLAGAEKELGRVQQLQASGVDSIQALDEAETTAASLRAQVGLAEEQVNAAEARVAIAQQDLDNTTIRAPFGGMIVSKDAQVGEIVSPASAGGAFTRTGIATIVDLKSLEIDVDVNESYISEVRPGQRVLAILDAYPAWQIPAHVRTVIPTADRQTATVNVRVSFDRLDPRILPDMGIKIIFLAGAIDGTSGSAKSKTSGHSTALYENHLGKSRPHVTSLLRADPTLPHSTTRNLKVNQVHITPLQRSFETEVFLTYWR